MTVASFLLAVVFAVSAGGKALQPRMFERALENTYHVPRRLQRIVARTVPALEMICALLLAIPSTRGQGLVMSSVLMSGFVSVQAVAWSAGWRGECGCLGALRQEALGAPTLLRAVGLTAISWVTLILTLARESR